jgi:hypothetical protein
MHKTYNRNASCIHNAYNYYASRMHNAYNHNASRINNAYNHNASRQVEQQHEDGQFRDWQIIGSPITRDTQDIGLCGTKDSSRYRYRIAAMSEPGPTTAIYRVILDPVDPFGKEKRYVNLH